MNPLVVSQFAEASPTPVFLSAARVPARRGERKSKDPEDVSSAMQLQGVLLKASLFRPLLDKSVVVASCLSIVQPELLISAVPVLVKTLDTN
jgi:hypothetical protein